MRNRVSLFEDQYKFYKVYKSKKLLCAFVEYMFEDVEPKNLSEKEQIIFESLRERMQKSKQISDGNSKGGQTSKRTKVVKNSEGNNRSELESSDKSKGKSTISQRVSQTQKKDNEVEVEEEVKEIGDNKLSHKESESDSELDIALNELVEARKKLKKPMTERAIKLVKNKLEKMYPGDTEMQIISINQSIERGWQSVFEVKEQDLKYYKAQPKKKNTINLVFT